jgi:hypothetical protein
MGDEEEYGLRTAAVQRLLAANSFRIVETVPFVFRIHQLYIAEKRI